MIARLLCWIQSDGSDIVIGVVVAVTMGLLFFH
jgi:hypothetical protein